MSKSAMAWLALYSTSLLATWINPIYGVMGIMTEYYRRPSLQWWGNELPRLRWNMIVTAVFAASAIFAAMTKKDLFTPLPKVDKRVMFWWALFAVNLLLVNIALPIDRGWAIDKTLYWAKVGVLMPALLIMVMRSRPAIDLFILANVIGVAFWGWEAYTDPKREASRLVNIGSGDTLNDNMAANHLVLMLPLVVAVLLNGVGKIRKIIGGISLPLTVNTIILCNSRGSTVGLIAGLATIPFLAKKGHKAKSVLLGAAVVGGFLLLADPQYIERQLSIADYEEDGSSQGRIEGWRQASRIVSDYPLGAGGRGFHILIPRYSEELAEKHQGAERAPHNTVILVATEYGVLGITLWALLYLSVFRLLLRVRRIALDTGSQYYYIRSVALFFGLTAWITSSMFSDRLYSEGTYWIVALALALQRVQESEVAVAVEDTSVQAHAA
jgi:putative inorganic carbon (hco3(-)) transporter